jgi:hypothetical protein
MMLGTWVPWNPLQKTSEKYFIKSYVSTFEECTFTFRCNTKDNIEICMSFGNGNEIYRKLKELYTSKLSAYIINTHTDFNRDWPLFIVENSKYLEDLSEESLWVVNCFKFKHYCIMDDEFTFDIVSQSEPRLELFIDNNLIEVSEAKWHV